MLQRIGSHQDSPVGTNAAQEPSWASSWSLGKRQGSRNSILGYQGCCWRCKCKGFARVLFFPDSAKLDSDHGLLNTLQKAFRTAGLFCTFNLSPERGERDGLTGKHQRAASCCRPISCKSLTPTPPELPVPKAPLKDGYFIPSLQHCAKGPSPEQGQGDHGFLVAFFGLSEVREDTPPKERGGSPEFRDDLGPQPPLLPTLLTPKPLEDSALQTRES